MNKGVTTKNTNGMKNKAYPKYKPSGVEWLGDLPEHWGVKKLKHTATLYGRIGFRGYTTDDLVDEGEGAITLSPSNMKNGELHLEKSAYISWDKYYESPEIIIKSEDVVIVKTGSTFGKISYIRQVEHPITLNPQLAVFKTLKCNNRFFFFYVGAPYIQDQISLSNTGSTIPTMTQQTIMSYAIPLPPLPEQQSIAAFLDRETGRIDSVITKKQRLLELLAEQRTALISRAVTKGLDAKVKLKPSCVEWLGDVPEYWVVTELRRFIRFVTSGSRGWAEHYSDDGKIFVRIGNLTRHSIDIDLSDIQYVDPPEGAEGERTKIASGDILFSITAYIGSVAVATEEIAGAYINQHIALVRPLIDKIYPRFVAYAGLSDYGQAQLSGQGYGGTKVQLALDDVKSLRIALPPLPEQQAIATFLDCETAKIDTLSAKVVTVIERLKEYRTAIISSAVTGKIDVRGSV